jgi:hypothetical protein
MFSPVLQIICFCAPSAFGDSLEACGEHGRGAGHSEMSITQA